MSVHPVFFDPQGRRKRLVTRLGAALALLLAVLTTLFGLSLLVIPLLPRIPGLSSPAHHLHRGWLPALPHRETRLTRYLLNRERTALFREMAHSQRPVGPAMPRPEKVVAAFYAPWQEPGLHSLRANADKLTHLMPEWLHLNRAGSGLDLSSWDPAVTPHNVDVLQIAREHRLRIQPILNNAEGGNFDPERVHRLLASPADQQLLARTLRDWLLAQHFQGVNLDLENLRPGDYARVPMLVRTLAHALRPAGLSISADIEAENDAVPLAEMARLCDFVVLMAYDEHWAEGKPGPIASIGWSGRVLARALRSVPPEKLVFGLASYAYDWAQGRPPAASRTYQEALMLARDYRSGERPEEVIDFDSTALNPTFDYSDDAGHEHQVWMLDAVTAYNQWLLASRAKVRGAALWVLGAEDPSIWTFLGRNTLFSPPKPASLEKVSFPYDIEYQGEGELLSVRSTPQAGQRRLESDAKTGLLTDMAYTRYPASFIIRRTGYVPRKLALTFDDGPDPVYTPQILDELKKLRVPATFFVVGEQADRYRGVVRRIWDEGHEIGSHSFTHPNMGAISERRAKLELNTTQRALQTILGRSTILFRPPYNADAEPSSAEEVKPLLLASRLGYVTVGELIDPQDWNLYRTGPEGEPIRRTPGEIAGAVLAGVRGVEGDVILLHDGGGDRSATIKALDLLVPALRKQGYTFVPVSALAGLSRNAVMPALAAKDQMLVGFDKVAFEAVFSLERFLTLAFILAIALGIARVFFVTPLALWGARRRLPEPEHPFTPPVTVLIAAYNERPVIVRTIRSVLESDYPQLEVVVVDDGSLDGTGDEVEASFGGEVRVRLLRQANSGKAAALNNGIAKAAGELLICFDADTQIAPNTISMLVRHFADPLVAAVAGNVKVGNRVNILTRWQAIEYITSQNLDRRAYALLNAVTVVPGAVGAWRRKAVQEVGGYLTDTLAEDMDLTWRLRRAGWRVETESEALGFTEAPDTLRAFSKQRFRWAYGTLQCLWKHRGALGRNGWFGGMALPALWIFQVGFQALAPLVDLRIAYALGTYGSAWLTRGLLRQDWQPLPEATHFLAVIGFSYAVFFLVEMVGAVIAFRLDRERLSLLWWLFWQRFVYRQLMYAVIWKSLWMAIQGTRQGWGKLQRKGTVKVTTVIG